MTMHVAKNDDLILTKLLDEVLAVVNRGMQNL
jgi:hypothetical protein